jgi:hypothetical protein
MNINLFIHWPLLRQQETGCNLFGTSWQKMHFSNEHRQLIMTTTTLRLTCDVFSADGKYFGGIFRRR